MNAAEIERELIGVLRWLLNRPCREEFCHERRRCWRWHVEVFACPTCGHEVTEFDKEPRDRIIAAMFKSSNDPRLTGGTAGGSYAWSWDPSTGEVWKMQTNG